MDNFKLKGRTLIKIIRLLSKAQQQKSLKYLKSPYLNSDKSLPALFRVLVKNVLSTKETAFNRAEIVAELAIASSTLEKSLSKLMDCLLRFLELELLFEKENRSYGKVLLVLGKMGLDKHEFLKEHRKYERKLQKVSESVNRFHLDLELEHSLLWEKANSPRKGEQNLFDEALLSLDRYYLVSKLKYMCASLNVWRIHGGNRPAGMDKELEKMKLLKAEELPLLGQAYGLIGRLLEKEGQDDALFQKSFLFLQENRKRFSIEDQEDLFGYILNSCFRQVAKGLNNYSERVHAIYLTMLETGLLLNQGKFNSGHFKNIVSIQVLLGKTEAAAVFIQQYGQALAVEERELVVSYTNGVVLFHQGEFKSAMALFKKVIGQSPEDLFWALESRSMLWKCYFRAWLDLSQGEHDEMVRLYHSFRVFLSRTQKISPHHKMAYQNFLRIFQKLIHYAYQSIPKTSAQTWKALLEETEGIAVINNKKWLLKIIGQF